MTVDYARFIPHKFTHSLKQTDEFNILIINYGMPVEYHVALRLSDDDLELSESQFKKQFLFPALAALEAHIH